MSNILTKILDHKRGEVARAKAAVSLEQQRENALACPLPVAFGSALRSAPVGLIAEVKRRSPSAGAIREPFDPPAIAQAYQAGGAQALSVLMDHEFFGGGADDYRAVRAAVDLPMLFKEFVVDPWQVWQARELGASAVLLIAAALPEAELASLMDTCREAGLEVLFEVHDGDELDVGLRLQAPILGINNRNLKTFHTTLDTTPSLRERVPEEVLLVSESGIRDANDIARLQAANIHAVLVGEHLLRKDDVAEAVRALMGGA